MSQDSKKSSQNNSLTKDSFGIIYGGFPNHWTLSILDKSNSSETCQILRDEILKNQEIIKELQFRKKHPMAMNYATFEQWVTDLLEGKIEAN